MADTTPKTTTTTPAKTAAPKPADEKPASRRGPSMTEQTVLLGTEIRDAAHDIKARLNELLAKGNALITDNTPTDTDSPAIGSGIQRLRVAVDDLHRWVDGLASAAADLERVTETPTAP